MSEPAGRGPWADDPDGDQRVAAAAAAVLSAWRRECELSIDVMIPSISKSTRTADIPAPGRIASPASGLEVNAPNGPPQASDSCLLPTFTDLGARASAAA